MAARSHGNGTNFDWLRKSCDISTCDLSPNGNPEKYRRPMKSAIVIILMLQAFVPIGQDTAFGWLNHKSCSIGEASRRGYHH